MVEESVNLSVDTYKALSVKYGDVIITINGDEDGILHEKTQEQALSFCADILYSLTDVSSLENLLDTNIGLQETLKEDYGWDDIQINTFITKWRKRIYIKRIGEDNKEDEEANADIEQIRPAVEPSSQSLELVSDNTNCSVIVTPNKDDEVNSFSNIEKDK